MSVDGMTVEVDDVAHVEPVATAPRRSWLVVVVALVVVAAAVLGLLVHRAQGVADAREAALSSAEKRIPALLSYQHDRLDADLTRAVGQTASSFRGEYGALLEKSVKPIATRDKVDNTAVVSGAGVVSATRDSVVVLAFITQSTSKAGGAPAVSGSRVEVTLERGKDESWLISALKPV